MPTVKTGQHYCNDRCTTLGQSINCYSFNRSRNYGIWTQEASNYYDKLYIPPIDNREALYRGKTLDQCKSYLRTFFKPLFFHDNIVSVTWRGYDSKSNTGDCYTYTQVGDTCSTPVENINVSVKPKDRDDMAPALTHFLQHALHDWFR